MFRPRSSLGKVLNDIRNRRHLESYSLFVIVLALTILNLVGELPDRVVTSAVLASLALLIYSSVTTSSHLGESVDAFLLNRERLQPLPELLTGATEVWIYAPTLINTIPRYAGDVKAQLLSRGGRARVLVMDPNSPYLGTLQEQFSTSGADVAASLSTTLSVLKKMTSWGNVEYRLLPFNPGFSILVIDPHSSSGRLLVESHGFQDSSVTDHMHIEIHRSDSLLWFDYWMKRFEAMWEAARKPSYEQEEQPAPE